MEPNEVVTPRTCSGEGCNEDDLYLNEIEFKLFFVSSQSLI